MGVSKIMLFTIAILLYLFGCLHGVNSEIIWEYFIANDLWGLQSLWQAWKNNTPNTDTNLAFWTSNNQPQYPCYNAAANWRGVTCLRYDIPNGNGNQDTRVIGLELSDASIVGMLPSGIGNLTFLVTLSLTGNPNLTGPLPNELASLPLNILDLHNNGFSGSIPTNLAQASNLLQLDLSGNQFTGEFPTQFLNTETLQEFSIGSNQLQGTIQSNAFENLTQLLTLDISDNNFIGPLPNLSSLSILNSLNLSYNKFTELPQLPEFLNSSQFPTKLVILDISSLNIGGPFPTWTSSRLMFLEELYLDNININGTLDITNIQTMMTSIDNSRPQGLQVLSLRNNNITNVIYNKSLLTEGRTIFYLQGNPYCQGSLSGDDGKTFFCAQFCIISSNKSDWKVIVISTTISGFLFGLIILALGITLHRSKEHVRKLMKNLEELDIKAKRFDYNELRVATKNFAEDRKLGAGAYGVVYKGVLANNIEVAVKQLFIQTQHGSEEFLNEILLISNLQHRNLVALKGYCLHGKEMLLVYEFVEFCDLEKFLFDTKGEYLSQVMNWPTRMKICLGVAQGLYYLHVSSQTRIIHRDIKASNILLDKDLNPKIADFGLARPIQDGKSEIMTQKCAGTIGYLAPEYMLYGQLSNKADVYSFGILLLETISGTKNRDPNQPEDEIYLPIWAWKLHSKNSLMDLIDPRLQCNNIELFEVKRVLEIAILCVQTSAEKRPTMFRVVAMLAGDANVVISNDEENEWPIFQLQGQYRDQDPLLDLQSSSISSAPENLTNETFASIELSASNVR
ncbi:hypothetical protein CY35_U001000 [Sphagnum magellanicum]|uniref:Protein kinase domain-containing protein n=1 Tax=Sphagnum magellanicum TaxID=128215 RepID=A0AAD4QIE5_9BRYO|nr:hypothetical protein CY35_U001000 [Sphagnum magellanicum]KAH9530407.1 hypothetical protein CY35_U001000 [Sphagnum magellanicum]